MSSLPPNIVASAMQAPFQQRQVHQAKAADDRRQSDMSQAIVRAGEQHENLIENTDADSRVEGDASGAGSQGRAFREEPQPDLPSDTPAADTDNADDPPHLDITA